MKVLKWLAATLLGVLLLLLLWGLLEPYLIDEEAYVARVPRLPPAWENQKVAQLSDWQVGMWLDNEPTVRRMIDRLTREQPAAVLLTGDFIYQSQGLPRPSLDKAADMLNPLEEADIPVYAVLGNHDYGVSSPGQPPIEERAEAVRRVLRKAGVTVLKNEAVALPAPEGTSDTPQAEAPPLYLVGIGSHWAGMAKPKRAVAKVPGEAPRLVMMHHPDSFAPLPAHTAPLAVAGHTHGGQVRLPWTPAWTWLTYVKQDRVHADGWITGYGQAGNRLYVNRGIGMGVLPLRINCQPELTMFTLQSVQEN